MYRGYSIVVCLQKEILGVNLLKEEVRVNGELEILLGSVSDSLSWLF